MAPFGIRSKTKKGGWELTWFHGSWIYGQVPGMRTPLAVSDLIETQAFAFGLGRNWELNHLGAGLEINASFSNSHLNSGIGLKCDYSQAEKSACTNDKLVVYRKEQRMHRSNCCLLNVKLKPLDFCCGSTVEIGSSDLGVFRTLCSDRRAAMRKCVNRARESQSLPEMHFSCCLPLTDTIWSSFICFYSLFKPAKVLKCSVA